jgi:DNA-3-methyladenine glycosylase
LNATPSFLLPNKRAKLLPRDFYERPAYQVAPELLGCVLVRQIEGYFLRALICETEAYQGQDDQACHARGGPTPRCQVMFEEAGHAYIYFTYGMHWMLNVVCEPKGTPAAVLIRAVYPLEGLEKMQELRPKLAGTGRWLDGPAKLTQAMGLDRSMNGADICDPQSGLRIEQGIGVPGEVIRVSPRIGIKYAPEPWQSMPWRWEVAYSKMADLIGQARIRENLPVSRETLPLTGLP